MGDDDDDSSKELCRTVCVVVRDANVDANLECDKC